MNTYECIELFNFMAKNAYIKNKHLHTPIQFLAELDDIQDYIFNAYDSGYYLGKLNVGLPIELTFGKIDNAIDM